MLSTVLSQYSIGHAECETMAFGSRVRVDGV